MAARPIVAGTDGSEESLRAVEWAAGEAVRWNVPLRIVAVPAMPPLMSPCDYTHGRDASPAAVTGMLRSEARGALSVAAGRATCVAPGLPVGTDLLSGPPARALAGSGAGASMLVAGARGAGGYEVMILGPVSRYVAMHAPCPVTIVRGTIAVATGEIAVGVRNPEDAAGALGFAFGEAAVRGARLLVVHAWSWFAPAFTPLTSYLAAAGGHPAWRG